MAYEVNIDGHTRQAHVDHLKPNPRPALGESETDSLATNDQSLTDDSIDDSNSVILIPLVFMEDDPTLELEPVTELNQRPQRHRNPPQRLIEEIP